MNPSVAFRKLLENHDFKGSMSRKGNCWDNAVAESFFGSLKQERVQWRSYQTRYAAQQDILNYISMFYNSYRLHSYLDYCCPNNFEEQLIEMKKQLNWIVSNRLTMSYLMNQKIVKRL